MSEEKSEVQLKVVATDGENTFERVINIPNGNCEGNNNIWQNIKFYILSECNLDSVLNAIIGEESDDSVKVQKLNAIAGNQNISRQMADKLVDCFIESKPSGITQILQNPRVSGEKLDQVAESYIKSAYDDLLKRGSVRDSILRILIAIARNPSIMDETRNKFKESGLSMIATLSGPDS